MKNKLKTNYSVLQTGGAILFSAMSLMVFFVLGKALGRFYSSSMGFFVAFAAWPYIPLIVAPVLAGILFYTCRGVHLNFKQHATIWGWAIFYGTALLIAEWNVLLYLSLSDIAYGVLIFMQTIIGALLMFVAVPSEVHD